MKIKVTRTFISGIQQLEKSAEASFETEFVGHLNLDDQAQAKETELRELTERTKALLNSLA